MVNFSCFRFLFDNGSEQNGEYIIKEEIKEPEVEGEEALILKTPKWAASSIEKLQKVSVNLEA